MILDILNKQQHPMRKSSGNRKHRIMDWIFSEMSSVLKPLQSQGMRSLPPAQAPAKHDEISTNQDSLFQESSFCWFWKWFIAMSLIWNDLELGC